MVLSDDSPLSVRAARQARPSPGPVPGVVEPLAALAAALGERFWAFVDRLDAVQARLAPGSPHDASWQGPAIGEAGLS